MQIGKFTIGFAPKEKAPPSQDISYSHSMLYAIGDFPRYNPDDLIGAKGPTIYRKMLRDEQVKAAARFRRNSVTGRGWSFQFPDNVELSDEEKERRIRVMTQIVKKMPGSFKRKLDGIMTAMYFGFSMTEKTFQPVVIDSKTYWGLKNLRTKPFDTFEFDEDEFGNLERVVQRIGTTEIELPADRFIHHVYNQDEEEYYGQSELRECYRSYFSKDIIIKFQNMYLERMAGGFAYAKPTGDASDPTPGSKQETQLRSVLSNLQTATGILLPKGFDLDVVHPSSTDAFEKAIIMYNLAIAKGLLMPNLLGYSEQGPNGSRALGDTQLEAFLWMLDAEANDLQETLNEQLFAELGEYNFGDGVYPEFQFRPLSQTMIKIVASLWGDLVQKGAVQRTESDEAWLRDLLGAPEAAEPEEDPLPDEDVPDDPEEPEDPEMQEDLEEGEADDETVVGKGQLAIDYTRFSRAENRVNFAQIDTSSNVALWQGVERLGGIFRDLTEQTIEAIRENPALLEDPAELQKLKTPPSIKRKLGKEVKAVLKEGWDIGTNNAEQEVAKARGARMSKEHSAKFASVGDIAAKYFAAKEFMITGKLLEDYRNVVSNGILNGIKYSKGTDEVISDITKSLAAKGMIDPEFVEDMLGEALETKNPRARLETVVRTNTFDALNEARYSYFTDDTLGGFVTGMEYSAILDSRTTDFCREADGTVLVAGSAEWDRLRPPNHFNCRSILVAVTERDDLPPTGLPDAVASGEVAPSEGFS